MDRIKSLLRNRDFLLTLAVGLGLFAGQGATWTEKAVIPALALVMTLSTMGVSGRLFLSPRKLLMPALVGIGMNYGVLGGLILGLDALFVPEGPLRDGFILVAAVPPAIAVIPFTVILQGNSAYILIATIGCYLGALVLTPLITVGILGASFVDPKKILTIMGELIFIPLFLSRILLWTKMAQRLEPVKGIITNWSFFIVIYTIIGLNQPLIFSSPSTILPAALIALIYTFFLGLAIEKIGRLFRLDSKTLTVLVLLGTHKNTGLAAGLALALFNEKTAVPAAVSTIFMLGFFIWLSSQRRGSQRASVDWGTRDGNDKKTEENRRKGKSHEKN